MLWNQNMVPEIQKFAKFMNNLLITLNAWKSINFFVACDRAGQTLSNKLVNKCFWTLKKITARTEIRPFQRSFSRAYKRVWNTQKRRNESFSINFHLSWSKIVICKITCIPSPPYRGPRGGRDYFLTHHLCKHFFWWRRITKFRKRIKNISLVDEWNMSFKKLMFSLTVSLSSFSTYRFLD